MLGRLLAGKYALIDAIGQGGMGAVYLGVQEPVGREVAVKVIRRLSGPGTDQLAARFAREARAIGHLSHDNLVTLYDYGEDEDGTLYLVMELLRGQSLRARLNKAGALEPSDAVFIACQVLAAIAEAHELGLVHRDLKPGNVILVPMKDGTERAKVLDFGIAKSAMGADDTVETRQGIFLGTPRYMAPEQAMRSDIGPTADIYACGIMLFEMLTGGAPFAGETPFAVMTAHRTQEVPAFPAELGIPPELEAAVRRALAKEPALRFPDAATMSQAIRAAIDGGRDHAALPAGIVSTRRASPVVLSDSTTVELSGQAIPPSSAGDEPAVGSRLKFVVAAVVVAALMGSAYLSTQWGAGRPPSLVGQPVVLGASPQAESPRTAPPPPPTSVASPAPSVPPATPASQMASEPPIVPASNAPPERPAAARPRPAAARPPPKLPAPQTKPAVRIEEF